MNEDLGVSDYHSLAVNSSRRDEIYRQFKGLSDRHVHLEKKNEWKNEHAISRRDLDALNTAAYELSSHIQDFARKIDAHIKGEHPVRMNVHDLLSSIEEIGRDLAEMSGRVSGES